MKHKHAELMKLYAEDAMETETPWERWEIKVLDEWRLLDWSPNWGPSEEYRRIPTKKPVDLSVLIESGIDVETSEYPDFRRRCIGELRSIDKSPHSKYPYYKLGDWDFDAIYCRPRMNHWHAWQGGECPLPEGVVADAVYRDGEIRKGIFVKAWNWEHKQSTSMTVDIIAFKVIGLADGYSWPWENEE